VSTDRSTDADRAVRAAYARGLGAGEAPLDDGRVLVVERPDGHWGYLAVGAAFAHATLLSVAPELVEVARSVAPEVHGPGALLRSLSAIRDHERSAGRERTLHAPSIGWSLGAPPPTIELPDDLEVRVVTKDELNSLIPDGVFENGAGPADGTTGREFRNLYGVIVSEPGRPVAVAGVFDTYGLHEIGVDVVAERRGDGLGRLVVAAAVREIVSRGGEPFYGCSPTNVVSQRTAWSVGFRPTMADAAIT
jgi:hypothetical protein